MVTLVVHPLISIPPPTTTALPSHLTHSTNGPLRHVREEGGGHTHHRCGGNGGRNVQRWTQQRPFRRWKLHARKRILSVPAAPLAPGVPAP
jgi:hypothetical protein